MTADVNFAVMLIPSVPAIAGALLFGGKDFNLAIAKNAGRC
jgi:hypothetical protein